MQYRALRGGARLGRAIGRDVDVIEYDARATMILEYMQVGTAGPTRDFCFDMLIMSKKKKQTFWNAEEEFMTETTITDIEMGRSGYGSAPLTVSVYNFDPSLGCDDATFQPCSPRALSSLRVVGDRFRDFFPLSQNFTNKQPPYFGFFTEDEFIGGHVSSISH